MELSKRDQDWTKLNKGDYIMPDTIEEYLGMKRTETKYAFELMKMAGEITAALANVGRIDTVCIRQGGIAILSDAEAIEYNDSSFERSLRGMKRSHHRLLGVESSNLDAGDKRTHERTVTRQAAILTTVSDTCKRLGAEPHERK
jgi:hypothetical protein